MVREPAAPNGITATIVPDTVQEGSPVFSRASTLCDSRALLSNSLGERPDGQDFIGAEGLHIGLGHGDDGNRVTESVEDLQQATLFPSLRMGHVVEKDRHVSPL
jgi:hypothetical protein